MRSRTQQTRISAAKLENTTIIMTATARDAGRRIVAPDSDAPGLGQPASLNIEAGKAESGTDAEAAAIVRLGGAAVDISGSILPYRNNKA